MLRFALVLPAVVVLCLGACVQRPPTVLAPGARNGVHIAGKNMEISLKNVDSIDVVMPEYGGNSSPLWQFLSSVLMAGSTIYASHENADSLQSAMTHNAAISQTAATVGR